MVASLPLRVVIKKIKNLGNRNVDLQVTQFNNNAQPLYVIVDADGKELLAPYAYNEDIDAYVKFLDSGKANFNKK
jgi:thiol:disulfide interchange protein DsbD